MADIGEQLSHNAFCEIVKPLYLSDMAHAPAAISQPNYSVGKKSPVQCLKPWDTVTTAGANLQS